MVKFYPNSNKLIIQEKREKKRGVLMFMKSSSILKFLFKMMKISHFEKQKQKQKLKILAKYNNKHLIFMFIPRN